MAKHSRERVYHIRYTEFSDIKRVTCEGMTSASAFYFRKHFEHHFIDIDKNSYIVTSSVRLQLNEAALLAQAHVDGKFEKHDTGDWD